jgi:NAD(P)H dehydrogenase (quinone)
LTHAHSADLRHPVEENFCAALRDIVRDTLLRNRHVVCVTDLYAEGFAPVLGREERLAYETAGANVTGVGPYVDRLRWAEGLILAFPTWWCGMPAILKGYFDRTGWIAPHPEAGRTLSAKSNAR